MGRFSSERNSINLNLYALRVGRSNFLTSGNKGYLAIGKCINQRKYHASPSYGVKEISIQTIFIEETICQE